MIFFRSSSSFIPNECTYVFEVFTFYEEMLHWRLFYRALLFIPWQQFHEIEKQTLLQYFVWMRFVFILSFQFPNFIVI